MKLTDKQIEEKLQPFIGNIKIRKEKMLEYIDLRFLYNATKRQIEKHPELQTLDVNVLINNSLIMNTTRECLEGRDKINDMILLNIIENASFIGKTIRK